MEEEEKKHVPKFSLFFFFCVGVEKMEKMGLLFSCTSRESEKKSTTRKKEEHRGETDATHKKK